MGPRVAQNWDRFLTAGGRGSFAMDSGIGNGPERARGRVAHALKDLGPGLSDVVLRCCCYLEGLEAAEKKLGWSARSGKIVLRIALMRLKQHYDETTGPGGGLIGAGGTCPRKKRTGFLAGRALHSGLAPRGVHSQRAYVRM